MKEKCLCNRSNNASFFFFFATVLSGNQTHQQNSGWDDDYEQGHILLYLVCISGCLWMNYFTINIYWQLSCNPGKCLLSCVRPHVICLNRSAAVDVISLLVLVRNANEAAFQPKFPDFIHLLDVYEVTTEAQWCSTTELSHFTNIQVTNNWSCRH